MITSYNNICEELVRLFIAISVCARSKKEKKNHFLKECYDYYFLQQVLKVEKIFKDKPLSNCDLVCCDLQLQSFAFRPTGWWNKMCQLLHYPEKPFHLVTVCLGIVIWDWTECTVLCWVILHSEATYM